jgi:hypothetical protein
MVKENKMISTKARLTKEQEKIFDAYRKIQNEWKSKGVSKVFFETAIYKIAIEMKPEELARKIKEQIG